MPIGQQTDPGERLRSFIASLTQAGEELQTCSAALDVQEAALVQHEATLTEGAQALSASLERIRDEAVEQLDAFSDDIKLVLESVAHGAQQLMKMSQGISTLQEDAEQLASAAEADFGQALDDATVGGFDVLSSGSESLTEHIETLKEKVGELFDDAVEFVDDVRQTVKKAGEQAAAALREIEHAASDSVPTRALKSFEKLSSFLSNEATAMVARCLDDSQQLLSMTYGQVRESVETLAEQLMQAGGELLAEMQTYVTHTVKERFLAAVQEMVTSFIETLMAEIAEAILMMVAGSATTGALSPVIPELAIAKRVATVVNDILAALPLGG